MQVDVRIDLEDNAASTIETQHRACDDWITTFNFERPHEALGMKVPADVYRPSERRMSRKVVGGFPDGCTVTKVNKGGNIQYGDRKRFLSQGVGGQPVGLLLVGDVVQVWFCDLLLGTFPALKTARSSPTCRRKTQCLRGCRLSQRRLRQPPRQRSP